MKNATVSRIEEILNQVESLPTLPGLALDIMSIAENPNASLSDMVLLIQRDPSLTVKILKIANSAYYGYTRKVNNLQSALLILGLREIRNISLSISVINLFQPSADRVSFNHHLFWLHSSGCAQIARSLAFKLGFFELELEAFTAGLIHDIGKIIIDQFLHEDFARILDLVHHEHLSFYEAENKILGTNHALIGSWLAKKWALPSELVEAIEYHHHPEDSIHDPLLSSLIHTANVFGKAKNLSFLEEFRGESISDNNGWKILQNRSPRKNISFDIERFTFGLDEEISKAQQFITISRGIDL